VQTVAFDGKNVPVMTQADVERVLDRKVPISAFVRASGTIDLFVAIDKDGTVQNVEFVSGDKAIADEAKDAVKQWRFKPFVKDGEEVAVQRVIELAPKPSEKQ
jgi:TonB family protein